MKIYVRPKSDPNMTTLVAKRRVWREASELLDANNKQVYGDLIRRNMDQEGDVIFITIGDTAAQPLLRFFGLTA
jgi:hypothetical protein